MLVENFTIHSLVVAHNWRIRELKESDFFLKPNLTNTTKKFSNVMFTSITLLNDMGSHDITMRCLELHLNLSLPMQLLEHMFIIFRGPIMWKLNIELCYLSAYRTKTPISKCMSKIWTLIGLWLFHSMCLTRRVSKFEA